jgi:hypothetical protein
MHFFFHLFEVFLLTLFLLLLNYGGLLVCQHTFRYGLGLETG